MVGCNGIGPDCLEVEKGLPESQRELTNTATRPVVRRFNRGYSGSAIAKRRPASCVQRHFFFCFVLFPGPSSCFLFLIRVLQGWNFVCFCFRMPRLFRAKIAGNIGVFCMRLVIEFMLA